MMDPIETREKRHVISPRLLVHGRSHRLHHRHWTEGRDTPPRRPIASKLFAPAGTKLVVAAALIGQTGLGVGNGSIMLGLRAGIVAPDGWNPCRSMVAVTHKGLQMDKAMSEQESFTPDEMNEYAGPSSTDAQPLLPTSSPSSRILFTHTVWTRQSVWL